jgi:regulator of replication initiation timing
MNLSDSDSNVRKKLAEMNIVPKDRKISNVVLENTNLKTENDSLKIENGKLRE